MNNPRIIFMGTPEFAVGTLDALVRSGKNIIAVITAPDKPAGRGMKLTTSAVKKYALEHNIPVLQPEKLKNPEFIAQLQAFRADLQVVVAFRMLPEIVWNMPPMGTINVHASLLPEYRGAAPINWSIINGEKKSGVTTFKLTHEIDTGNILLQQAMDIGEEETAGELHDALKIAGAALAVQTVEGLIQNTIFEQPQKGLIDEEKLKTTHAPKIFTETCRIDWRNSTEKIHNLIRGLSPFPGAFTELQGKIFKIYRAEKKLAAHDSTAGSFETDHKTFLRFACADGYIYAIDIQAEGKKRMTAEEFLRGFRTV
jgi:methionyl-tRNA formyltransferase